VRRFALGLAALVLAFVLGAFAMHFGMHGGQHAQMRALQAEVDAARATQASLLSGLAEPVGAAIGYFALSGVLSHSTFGIVFGMIAGVMVFLALDELLPAAKRYAKGHETVYGLVSGMATLAISLVLFKW